MASAISEQRTNLAQHAFNVVSRIANLAPERSRVPPKSIQWIASISSATSADLDDWIAKFASSADEIRAFCILHDIMKEAYFAAHVAEKAFPAGSKVALEIEHDPEADGSWLLVRVEIQDGTDPLPGYHRYVELLVAKLEPRASDKIHVTFFCS